MWATAKELIPRVTAFTSEDIGRVERDRLVAPVQNWRKHSKIPDFAPLTCIAARIPTGNLPFAWNVPELDQTVANAHNLIERAVRIIQRLQRFPEIWHRVLALETM